MYLLVLRQLEALDLFGVGEMVDKRKGAAESFDGYGRGWVSC